MVGNPALHVSHLCPRTDVSDSPFAPAAGFHTAFANSGLWGYGLYFAENASYSHDYAYNCAPGVKSMLLTKLIVGTETQLPADRNRRIPPVMQHGSSRRRYDTVTGVTNGSKVYIVYENGRAYPEYLVTYRYATQADQQRATAAATASVNAQVQQQLLAGPRTHCLITCPPGLKPGQKVRVSGNLSGGAQLPRGSPQLAAFDLVVPAGARAGQPFQIQFPVPITRQQSTILADLKQRYTALRGSTPRGPSCNDPTWLQKKIDEMTSSASAQPAGAAAAAAAATKPHPNPWHGRKIFPAMFIIQCQRPDCKVRWNPAPATPSLPPSLPPSLLCDFVSCDENYLCILLSAMADDDAGSESNVAAYLLQVQDARQGTRLPQPGRGDPIVAQAETE
jgi:hypothetical protein